MNKITSIGELKKELKRHDMNLKIERDYTIPFDEVDFSDVRSFQLIICPNISTVAGKVEVSLKKQAARSTSYLNVEVLELINSFLKNFKHDEQKFKIKNVGALEPDREFSVEDVMWLGSSLKDSIPTIASQIKVFNEDFVKPL